MISAWWLIPIVFLSICFGYAIGLFTDKHNKKAEKK